MKGLYNLAFVLVIVLESTWSWTCGEGWSRRQLLKVAGCSTVALVVAPVFAEDAIGSTVEVAATGDAKKVRRQMFGRRVHKIDKVC